ncbi:MAG: aa3-type cytochrome c oxidase subunit IV [Novosphingobium sp.]
MGLDCTMASGNDMKAHEATYGGFLGLLKFSIPVVIVITVIVLALIS